MIEHVISSLNVNESVSSGSSQPIVNFEAQDKKDRADRVAAYRRQKNAEVRREQLLFLVGLWPIAIGCVLALFAPQLRDILTPNHPWALRLVFPLVSIAARPELNLGSTLASILPGFLLYAQFPLEGLVARIAVKSHVTLGAVGGQLLFLHSLGAAHVLLLSGNLTQIGKF
jgi:hypothetical protein